MSLFALGYEYQRSIDRAWEDFSAHSRAQTKSTPQELETDSRQSILNLRHPGEGFEQDSAHKAIKPQAVDAPTLMQNDPKAWGCFLDGKRKGTPSFNDSESASRGSRG